MQKLLNHWLGDPSYDENAELSILYLSLTASVRFTCAYGTTLNQEATMDHELIALEQLKEVKKNMKESITNRINHDFKKYETPQHQRSNTLIPVKFVRRDAFFESEKNPLQHTTVIVDKKIYGYGGAIDDHLVTTKSKSKKMHQYEVGCNELKEILLQEEIESKTKPYNPFTNNCNTYAESFFSKIQKKKSFRTKSSDQPDFTSYKKEYL